MAISGLKAFFTMKLILILAGLITAGAQTISCNGKSHDCCWVRKAWTELGKTANINYALNATACCDKFATVRSGGIPGMRCDDSGRVTSIYWMKQALTGKFPTYFDKLTNLKFL